MNLTAEDFGGEPYEGCNEHLVLTKPDAVARVHRIYLDAGCDIVETNTFGGTSLVLNEYRLANKTYEINRRAAEIARSVAPNTKARGRPGLSQVPSVRRQKLCRSRVGLHLMTL